MTSTVPAKVARGALVIRGDALSLPLRDNSVDLIVTSPPYFALRAYGTGHEMEVGSEATPQAYLEALWAATREMVRVLKPSGSIWIDLGDKYAGSRMDGSNDNGSTGLLNTKQIGGVRQKVIRNVEAAEGFGYKATTPGVREKSLIGLPWRYALGCIDQLGLILRRDLIWSKPNGLPESVTDRPRSSHEYWFMFVKSPRYFAALDEIRMPHARLWDASNGGSLKGGSEYTVSTSAPTGHKRQAAYAMPHPLGALPGSVWSIPSEPLRLPPWIDTQHYAAFPSEWPRRLILGFSPSGICTVCGVGRFPVVERERTLHRPSGAARIGTSFDAAAPAGVRSNIGNLRTEATILGYACACGQSVAGGQTGSADRTRSGRKSLAADHLVDATSGVPLPPTRPAVVLDPFGGTGTTCHVARALGRIGISIDLSEAYCRLATDRTLAQWRAGKVLGRVHQERQGTLL